MVPRARFPRIIFLIAAGISKSPIDLIAKTSESKNIIINIVSIIIQPATLFPGSPTLKLYQKPMDHLLLDHNQKSLLIRGWFLN